MYSFTYLLTYLANLLIFLIAYYRRNHHLPPNFAEKKKKTFSKTIRINFAAKNHYFTSISRERKCDSFSRVH